MKLRFGVGSKQGRKNGDIEALADAMQALKKIGKLFLDFILNPTLALSYQILVDCLSLYGSHNSKQRRLK